MERKTKKQLAGELGITAPTLRAKVKIFFEDHTEWTYKKWLRLGWYLPGKLYVELLENL